MKILSEKDLIKQGNIDEVKDFMLYKVMLFSSLVGIPIILFNVYFSFYVDITLSGVINLIFFLPIISVLIFYRRINYEIKTYILIASVVAMSFFNFYVGAYTGASYMLLLSAMTFSVAFLNKRQALISIIFCILIATISGAFYVLEIWTLEIDNKKLTTVPSSWILSIGLYAFLSFLFLIAYNIIQTKLIQKIELEHKNNLILEQANSKLKEILIKQEEQQKELIIAKQKAEESNSLKNEFLHNMSHEVRTPLNAIIGFSKLFKKENISDEKRTQFADIVIHSGESLQKVIDDILEISFLETRQISMNIEKIDVESFLNDLFLIFTVNRQLDVDLKLKSPLEKIILLSDLHKLNKILGNLIENALKFTEKGSVEFGCYKSNDENVCFFVKDTGIGISEENFEKIFSRFSQGHDQIAAKFGGLGLGLCIAKENTELLQGKIRVESELGVGTIFYVEIPVNYKDSKD
ncbi:MAG TPA: ATP-binding protein [Bacteroidales bacterium]|nr:ATP-binding protein [Bacteroidales bacterium]